MIDYPARSMGCMVEVERDVVLVIYGDPDRPLLGQFVRVTPEGIEPSQR